MWEIGLIMLLALLVLGPHQLVEAAKVVGKLYREVQRMAWEVRDAVDLDTPLPTSNEKPTYSESEQSESSEVSNKAGRDEELLPPPGERSGPDFYAELLESSKETDEEDEQEAGEDSPAPSSGDNDDESAPGTEAGSDDNDVEEKSKEDPK
jgi:Sec-independent protein translocase protein TatA